MGRWSFPLASHCELFSVHKGEWISAGQPPSTLGMETSEGDWLALCDQSVFPIKGKVHVWHVRSIICVITPVLSNSCSSYCLLCCKSNIWAKISWQHLIVSLFERLWHNLCKVWFPGRITSIRNYNPSAWMAGCVSSCRKVLSTESGALETKDNQFMLGASASCCYTMPWQC